ncbi:MAG: hypothetical protein KIT34_10770 [Cyanobacteria bacterium TGS_CYA1]|nr:hypothetical protein [Cyanobacteria bacterium TGS_CYA1]
MSGVFYTSMGLALSIAFCSALIPCNAKQIQKKQNKTTQSTPQKTKSQTPSSFNSSASGAYLDRLREKMDKHWYLADGTHHVVIKAIILSNGSVENVELSSTPKSEAAEQAANEAFLKAQPLEALPSGSGQKCCIILNMESYADPHGDSRRTVRSRMEVVKPTSSEAPDTAQEKPKSE